MPIDLKLLLSEQDDIIFVVEGDEVVRFGAELHSG